MGRLFGTDGVRGVANVAPMDSDTFLHLGRAIAHTFRRREGRHRILIGKDTRVSGYMFETALASGICSLGVDVLLVGVDAFFHCCSQAACSSKLHSCLCVSGQWQLPC